MRKGALATVQRKVGLWLWWRGKEMVIRGIVPLDSKDKIGFHILDNDRALVWLQMAM